MTSLRQTGWSWIVVLVVLGAGCSDNKKKRPASWDDNDHAAATADEELLPQLIPPGDGPRAPTRSVWGIEIGKTTVAQIQDLSFQKLWVCKDRSFRALRKAARVKRGREARAAAEKAAAQGELVDAQSGASKRSGKKGTHDIPVFRWTCPEITSRQLGDRERPLTLGALLFSFDTKEHPVRHASYRRQVADPALARADVQQSIDAIRTVYGPPTAAPAKSPLGDGGSGFKEFVPFDWEWSYADFRVRVSAMRSGGSVSVVETYEVPWPVWVVAPKAK